MTAFVLVSEAFTGGWIWRDVAAGLRRAGAEVHPATLTGMGERRHLAGTATNLESHVQDLVHLIDHVDEPEVVIVGHGYGIHPVLGAADRRPERIARVVHLDAGLPQDGDAAAELVPDPALREQLSQRIEQAADDWRIPAPQLAEWERWGSLAGVPDNALMRLTRFATGQPVGTLIRPLRLSGAVLELPVTGVLCTANGSSITRVETLLGFGDPRFSRLTEPDVTWFELDTGHWPMLSCPDELVDVLLQAATGGGHHLPPSNELPAHLRPFLLDVPKRPRERVGRIDLHLPDTTSPAPAVVFVHGGPVPAEATPTPRDWPTFVGYGQYTAHLGAVGVTLDHRLYSFDDYDRAAQDVAEAVEFARADPRVDPERIALWYFSGGGLLAADPLTSPARWLRCLAATYPVLAPLPGWGSADSRFHPAKAVRDAGRLPMVLTKVEKENPQIAATIEEFLTSAEDSDVLIEVIDVPDAHHGFEALDHTEPARQAVELGVRSVLNHLTS